MAQPLPLDAFRDTLVDLAALPQAAPDPAENDVRGAAEALAHVQPLTRDGVADLIRTHPRWVPAIAACARLGQEQLKRQLRYRLGSEGWIKLARSAPERLIAMLDEEFGLLARIEVERARTWTFGDVLWERVTAAKGRAHGSSRRGRRLEDAAQNQVESLGLRPVLRTRFVGRDGHPHPCDLALCRPDGEAWAVVAAKGFNSTGSKLTDAVREIDEMATHRKPIQFVYVLIDGIGWLGRHNDLRRIHALAEQGAIDGLYSLALLGQFGLDLGLAARRVGVI